MPYYILYICFLVLNACHSAQTRLHRDSDVSHVAYLSSFTLWTLTFLYTLNLKYSYITSFISYPPYRSLN
jgi:hypothetical protein